MAIYIYVPQGHSARLTKTASLYDIEGLCTDGFSACNIIACVGTEKSVLIHADGDACFHLQNIKEEIQWVGEVKELFLIARKDGNILHSKLIDFFEKEIPSSKAIYIEIDENHDGVSVTFNKGSGNIHSQIKTYPIELAPENVLHHPQEQKFLSVRKIEQIIGLQAKLKTDKSRFKQLCIFDDCAWKDLDEHHFLVDDSHPLTKKEMKYFSKGDPYVVLSENLKKVIEDCNSNLGTAMKAEDFSSVIVCLEDYLNSFNNKLIFKQNMLNILSEHKAVSPQDKKIKEKLLEFLKDNDFDIEDAQKLFSLYEEEGTETEFKSIIIKHFYFFQGHFLSRGGYEELNIQYNEMLSSAKKLAQKGVKEFASNHFSAAKSLFLEALKLTTYSTLSSNPVCASTYYNYGRSLQKLDQFEEARFFLEISLNFKQNNVQPNPLLIDIEKTKKAIEECSSSLTQQCRLST